jgi:hypothetical protein
LEDIVIKELNQCPVCSNPIRDGVAYFSFGAVVDLFLLEEKGVSDDELEGFCHIGYHGARSDMSDSVGYCIARDVKGGQLDISFCSLACVKKWFCGIIDGLESQLRSQSAAGDP